MSVISDTCGAEGRQLHSASPLSAAVSDQQLASACTKCGPVVIPGEQHPVPICVKVDQFGLWLGWQQTGWKGCLDRRPQVVKALQAACAAIQDTARLPVLLLLRSQS